MNIRSAALLAAITLSMGNAMSADYGSQAAASGAQRYTFSWSLLGDALKPRGGSSKGAPVTLATEPSEAWRALQEKGLSAIERDRRAILAMAGDYRVTFDFLEVTPFNNAGAQAPYQSWGTEKVYVDVNEKDFISLVHILEMRIVQKDGSLSEPFVTKHWRQDWRYEPEAIVEYRGNDLWERRKLSRDERRGAWSQTVYQVDESPRYASIGRWQHTPSFSSWLSGETWRPLPRREWSVRDDYQLLIGTNRHTVGARGWVQEENNLKAVVGETGKLDATLPFVGREYGVARYQLITDRDFAMADRYYERTKPFWNSVREHWAEAFEDGSAKLRGPVDKLGLFHPLFARAGAIDDGKLAASAQDAEVIRSALRDMGALQ